ncbi:MAG: hypothetical protein ABJF11_01170 [Reichenbachiella sp.]|uniref:hypothetical protein n=1 Tax=Reichenbachiella sp. TaxID=2184521 RepID=UPI003263B82C
MIKSNLLFVCLLILGLACQPAQQKEQESTSSPSISAPQLVKVWETDTLMTTSESVIYDEFRDVLYVSNIGSVPPTAKDNDGFISIISTSGEVIDLDWVTEISAPKGMGIIDSSLFVTNIDEVVEIDIPSGVIVKRYLVGNAQFLNDITITDTEDILISDSNLNNIHKLTDGSMKFWMNDSAFHGSNGLLAQGDQLMVASYGGGEFYRVDRNTKTKTLVASGIEGGDGIVAIGENYLVSNWNGEVHFVDNQGNTSLLLDTKSKGKNAADICFIQSENLLLVPTFFGNTVAAYEVK